MTCTMLEGRLEPGGATTVELSPAVELVSTGRDGAEPDPDPEPEPTMGRVMVEFEEEVSFWV